MVGGAQAAIRDSTLHARVLVIVKKSKPQRERNGAALKPKASTLSYALDTAVVVIDRMTTMLAGLTSWLYPSRETEFQEINGDLPEADFWPGITSMPISELKSTFKKKSGIIFARLQEVLSNGRSRHEEPFRQTFSHRAYTGLRRFSMRSASLNTTAASRLCFRRGWLEMKCSTISTISLQRRWSRVLPDCEATLPSALRAV